MTRKAPRSRAGHVVAAKAVAHAPGFFMRPVVKLTLYITHSLKRMRGQNKSISLGRCRLTRRILVQTPILPIILSRLLDILKRVAG